MGWGTGNIGGGSGGGLNFKVVGNPQPTNPKENTIWLNTDVDITSWIFNANEPTEFEEGMVWFPTGASSPVEFNALKKNGIQVYPLAAKQYVSGALVDVTAQSYQNGAWVDWFTYLYNYGDECTAITGGWQGRAWGFGQDTQYVSATAPTISHSGSDMTIRLPRGHTGAVEIAKDVDLTHFTTLSVHGLANKVGGDWAVLLVINRNNTYWGTTAATTVWLSATSESEQTADISNIFGKYDIAFGLGAWDGEVSAKINYVRLER